MHDAVPPKRAFLPLLLAVSGLLPLGLAWSLALTTPPTPPPIDDPRLSCAQLNEQRDLGFGDFYAILTGHLEATERTGIVRVICDDGGVVTALSRTRVTGAPGVYRAHVQEGEVRLVEGCRGCDTLPARRDVSPKHKVIRWLGRLIIIVLGALGVWGFLMGWRQRPFDPLDDLSAGRAPAQALALERPSNDRVRIAGTTYDASVLSVADGKLIPSQADRSCLVLPGASPTYRDGVGALAHVVGPAKLGTLGVGAGKRVPIADGDLVELPGCPPFRVELPVPGLLVRYFHGDAEHARFVGRFTNERGKLHQKVTAAVGIAAITVALLDIPGALVLGGALLVLAAALAIALPRQDALRRETQVHFTAMNDVKITPLHGALCIGYRGRTIAWLPLPDDGELARSVHRELRALIAHAFRAKQVT